MNKGGSVLRTFRDGDEMAVLRLLDVVSGTCSLDEWAWLFPADERGRTIVVGERGGEVASVCAAAAVRLTIHGREHQGAEILKLVSSDRAMASAALEHFVDTFGAGERCAIILASLAADTEAPAGFAVTRPGRLIALVRQPPFPSLHGRLLYRAEPARDWEPRLDGLWQRVRDAYPIAVVRGADRALQRFAGHPRIRHHRFLVFPRFASRAVAFAVYAVIDSQLRWLDLIWDHDHPAALDMLTHISARLVAQLGTAGEELWLGGDDLALAVLGRSGFKSTSSRQLPRVIARALAEDLDAARFVDEAYLTASDTESPLI